MLVFCDCADKFPAVAMPAIEQSTAAAKRMRRLILSSPLQTTGRTLLARASMMARQTIAAAESPRPTVIFLSNIGTGRIGTLLFFVITRIGGKTVQTGSSGKVYAAGKA